MDKNSIAIYEIFIRNTLLKYIFEAFFILRIIFRNFNILRLS